MFICISLRLTDAHKNIGLFWLATFRFWKYVLFETDSKTCKCACVYYVKLCTFIRRPLLFIVLIGFSMLWEGIAWWYFTKGDILGLFLIQPSGFSMKWWSSVGIWLIVSLSNGTISLWVVLLQVVFKTTHGSLEGRGQTKRKLVNINTWEKRFETEESRMFSSRCPTCLNP